MVRRRLALGIALVVLGLLLARSRSAASLAARRAQEAGSTARAPPPPPPLLHMWHVADWHLNLWHEVRGDVVDMCRSTTPDSTRWPRAAGHWNCDPSRSLAAAAVRRMAALDPAPAAILLGGDSFGHVPPAKEALDALLASHRAMHKLLSDAFPQVPILPVIGNHDTWPYFSTDARAQQELAHIWGPRLSSEASISLRERGYYRETLRTDGNGQPLREPLVVICLETNALALPDTGVGGGHDDGGKMSPAAREQLHWLDESLLSLPNHSALIFGHIAPGASHVDFDSMAALGWEGGGLRAEAQATLYDLLRRHRHVIIALLFGHLHTPSVRLLTRPKELTGDMPVAYLSPSLTMRNPTPHEGAVRRYTLQSTAGDLKGSIGQQSSRTVGSERDVDALGAVGAVGRVGPGDGVHSSPNGVAVRTSLLPRGGGYHLHDMLDLVLDISALSAHGSRAPFKPMKSHSAHTYPGPPVKGQHDGTNISEELSWRLIPSVRSSLGLAALNDRAWRTWVDRLRHDDGAFCDFMPAQRCADEIESNYAKCKAAVICAISEGEPGAYSRCLTDVRRAAVAPVACQQLKSKRLPP
eukprot:scaffold199704_cov28-Tisochrysis_lutea.AAC.2